MTVIDNIAAFFPLPVPVVMLLFLMPMVLRMLRQARTKRSVIKQGEPGMARVISIAQTGTTLNQVPEMRLVLDSRAPARCRGGSPSPSSSISAGCRAPAIASMS